MGRYDVLIVGGGVIGSAIAWSLADSDDFDGRVLVVERDPSYARCSTALSAGSIRQQFSIAENILISRYGAQFLRAAPERLAVHGERPALSFVEGGYLFLASAAGLPVLRRNHALQRELGADVALLDAAELRARFAWLNVDDLAGGCLGLSGEGWFDPHGLLQAFRRKARSLGVDYLPDEVVGLRRAGGRVTAVELAGGDAIGCGWAVNAAGPAAARVAAMAGIALPVRSRKRYVFSFDCREPIAGAPLLVDPSGLYFRPEGEQFICGMSPGADEDPDCEDFTVDHDWFEQRLWPLLAARVPAFAAIRQRAAWAGHYAYNTVDQNAILGAHPDCANLLFANGFSGHGLQQSPAVGRAIAELICHGEFRALDLSALSFRALLDGRQMRERNVV